MTGVPGSLSELTPEWLTDVLRVSTPLGAGRVASADAKLIGGGNGLMSEVARLRLSYDADIPGTPPTLIVKLPPADAGSRKTGVDLGFFEHEARFYQDLAARTGIKAPRCYFTHFEPSDGSFLTLLEDLSDAMLGDISRGCSRDEGISAMRALAALHASWWNSPELTDLPWLQSREEWLAAVLGLIDEAWPEFLRRFGGELDHGELSALAGVHDVLSRAPRALAGRQSTLLHGDYKLDNMFFTADGEMTVFDWGLTMTGPPAFDVAFFIGLDLEPQARREYESDLIRAYVDALAGAGVHGYGYDALMADYRLQLVGLLPQLIAAGGKATFADEAAIARYANGLHRVLAAVEITMLLGWQQPQPDRPVAVVAHGRTAA